jgi:hypothetical protein
MRDLRGWLQKVEEMGELATISSALAWDGRRRKKSLR